VWHSRTCSAGLLRRRLSRGRPPAGATFGDLLTLAYVGVVTSNAGAALSTAAEVAEVLAEEERRQWPEPDVTITDDLQTRIVAALILRGGADEEQAANVIARLPELSDARRERIRDLTRWAGRVYPDRDLFTMPSLELLTYGLAVPALRDPILRASLTSDLDVLTLARACSFMIGAANTFSEAGAWVTELLQPSDLAHSIAGLMFGSASVPAPPQDRTDRLLAALIPKITERTTLDGMKPVLSDDIGYPQARLALLQALVVAVRTSYSHDMPAVHAADLATALTDLANALHDFGQYDEARAADQEAITLLRQLANEEPTRHLPELADALSHVADLLRHLGRYADGLAANQEAITLLRQLADQQSARHLPNLARALRNLGLLLSAADRHAEALAARQEAVTLLRQLANEEPTRYQPTLADDLNNLGVALHHFGQYDEALAAEQEAIALLRQLTMEQPDRYQFSLASALSNLATVLYGLGWKEDVRRYDQALAAREEAVTLLRPFADRYQPEFATSLSGLGAILNAVSRYDEAVATDQEAITILRRLADEQPTLHLPELARVLSYFGSVLSIVGRHDEAVATDQEAIALLRQLADEQPTRHLPELARVLHNFGSVLSIVGQYDEALAAYSEARALLDAIASDQPWHRGDVIELDQRIRELLRDLGRDEESIAFGL
jgi:tetratricopeptide (TPR) repeat protein